MVDPQKADEWQQNEQRYPQVEQKPDYDKSEGIYVGQSFEIPGAQTGQSI